MSSHCFTPQAHSTTEGEEIAYRRGFDQGAAAFAYALGISNENLQRLAFKRRVVDFRYGRVKDAPWTPTAAEQEEFRLVKRRLQEVA